MLSTSQIFSAALGDSALVQDATALSSTLDATLWVHPRVSLGAQLWSHTPLGSDLQETWMFGSAAAMIEALRGQLSQVASDRGITRAQLTAVTKTFLPTENA